MTDIPTFSERAKAYIDDIGAELAELEQKVSDAGAEVDEWTTMQATKLKADWNEAKQDMENIADRVKVEGEDAVREARENAERHYEALQAAVKAYRDHLEQETKA